MKLSYAMAFVSDMTRSVHFYRDVIGLPLKFESPEWSEFATEGASFALHKAGQSDKSGNEIPAAGQCRPGFSVPDLAGFHERMVEAAVPCVKPPHVVFGTSIAQYLDPDGLEISVSEAKARGD